MGTSPIVLVLVLVLVLDGSAFSAAKRALRGSEHEDEHEHEDDWGYPIYRAKTRP